MNAFQLPFILLVPFLLFFLEHLYFSSVRFLKLLLIIERGCFLWATVRGAPWMVNEPEQWPRLAGILMTQVLVWFFSFSLAINNEELLLCSLKWTCCKMAVWFLIQLCKFYSWKNQTNFKEAQASSPQTLFSWLLTKFCFFYSLGCGRSPGKRMLCWLCACALFVICSCASLHWSALLLAALPICGLGFPTFPSFIKDWQSLCLCPFFLL